MHVSECGADQHLQLKGRIESEKFEFYVDTGSEYSLLTETDYNHPKYYHPKYKHG